MELLQIATACFITKCDGQLLRSRISIALKASTTRFVYDDYYKTE